MIYCIRAWSTASPPLLGVKKIVTGCALIRRGFVVYKILHFIQSCTTRITCNAYTLILSLFNFSIRLCMVLIKCQVLEQYNDYLFPYTMCIVNVGSCYAEVLHKRCVITTRTQVWYAEQKQNNKKLNGMHMLTTHCFVKTH